MLFHPPSLAAVGSLEAMHEVLLQTAAMNVLDGPFAAARSGKVGDITGLETDAALFVGC